MDKSVEQLILTMEKEYEIYKEVLDLAKKKKGIIVEGKVKELDDITKREQGMIINLGKLENIREAVVNNIIKELEIKSVENIKELADYLSEDNRKKVLEARDKLITLLDEVKRENDLNGKLIKQSLDYIEFNRNLLINAENKGSIYGSKADEKDVKVKTNLFDAKV